MDWRLLCPRFETDGIAGRFQMTDAAAADPAERGTPLATAWLMRNAHEEFIEAWLEGQRLLSEARVLTIRLRRAIAASARARQARALRETAKRAAH